jgi:NitT/TauT family transport system substrate-binding protein
MLKQLILISLFIYSLNASEKREKIVIAGPFTNVSHPIFHMIETNSLEDITNKIEFRYWKNQDQLRAMIMRGDIDFMAIPINVAANLYNKGIDLKLLNVSIWGNYGIVSSDANIKSIKDLKGKSLAVPSRGDMPDIIIQKLLKENGMDYKKDINIAYMPTPIDGLSMIVKGKINNAFLPEPALSMAILKAKQMKRKLYLTINIQDEYKKTFNTTKTFPQVGFAIMGKNKNNIRLINRFINEYKRSMLWYKNNPKEASKIVVKYLPMLKQKAIEIGIKNITINTATTKESKKQIKNWFKNLKQFNSKLIGGKLPDEEFYFNQSLDKKEK